MFQKNNKDGAHPVIEHGRQLSIGDRASDRMTEFMGSWTFIIVFSLAIATWVVLNILMVINHWDPYPFILLNLMLSCLSAYQAPIILMSQNRQADRDRITAKYDYAVNRKAEREIQNMQKDLDEIKALLLKMQPKSRGKTTPSKKVTK
ncbi:DUF1003 domain-containing protein [Candidatus Nomurabacteria bacterium]|nr:DUF1003 domain-containing protein [Candidatus Nomurabacteria bacterium]